MMDNIDLLLESLDAHIENNETVEDDPFTQTSKEENSCLSSFSENNDASSSNDLEVEKVKKSVSKKYSDYGYEIHKQLKEKVNSSYDKFKTPTTSWKIQPKESQKKDTLSVTQTAVKNDVYAEPVFGLRLINPVVSSQFIQSKMVGRTPVTLEKLPNHLTCGDKNTDWVFAGAVVFKSGLKTSQKGSQYCLWKISDLKNDLKQVTVYLFGKAGSELWKLALGTVVAILNATPLNKDEAITKDNVTLSVRNADQVMIWGISRDYGICKAKKKNGDNCTSFVNKTQCEFCLYHVKSEYKKFSGKRFDLQASNSLTELRNKVLGKSEVFYGGKSFTALKAPPKNCKQREKDRRLLNNLSRTSSTGEKFNNQCNMTTSNQQKLDKLKENVSISNIQRKSDTEYEKPAVSARMRVFKEAGEKLLQTGEGTRISSGNLKKRDTYVSFASVFKLEKEESNQVTKTADRSIVNNIQSEKKTTSVIEGKSEKFSSPITLKPCKEIVIDLNEPSSSKPITTKFGDISKRTIPRTANPSNKKSLSVVSKSLNSTEIATSNSFQKSIVEWENNAPNFQTIDSDQTDNFLRTKMQSLGHRSTPQPSNSIHKKKLDQAKMNAIRMIKQKGGLSKINPNQIRSTNDDKRTAAVKRALESSEDGIEEEISEADSIKKSVLSQRFIDLVNAQSKHENLAQLAADMEEQNYFNKMEKKEELEEKMLTTYKVPCKAVSCLKCKYKWFSASDLCKAEGHPIKVIDAMKRFFKCQNCSNRTVSLEIVPLMSCKQCGSSKWSRAPMIREKVYQNNSNLSIRGDEVTFLDSFAQKQNLNLLVPD